MIIAGQQGTDEISSAIRPEKQPIGCMLKASLSISPEMDIEVFIS